MVKRYAIASAYVLAALSIGCTAALAGIDGPGKGTAVSDHRSDDARPLALMYRMHPGAAGPPAVPMR